MDMTGVTIFAQLWQWKVAQVTIRSLNSNSTQLNSNLCIHSEVPTSTLSLYGKLPPFTYAPSVIHQLPSVTADCCRLNANQHCLAVSPKTPKPKGTLFFS